MNSRLLKFPSAFFATAFGLVLSAVPAAMAVDFESEIRPILKEKCYKCHSGPSAKKGLRYDDNDTLAEFIADGKDNVIVPGKPTESKIVIKPGLPRDDTDAMPPPRRGDPLTADEIKLIAQWVEEGASLESTGAAPAMTDTKPAADPNQVHSWTNTKGVTIQAPFVRLEGENVVILFNGKETKVSMRDLSAESRAQATKLAGR